MMLFRYVVGMTFAVGVLLFDVAPTSAQHGHAMSITSDVNGGGELQLGWDFDALPIARTSDSGVSGVFTNNVPGLNDGVGDGATTFTLNDGTNLDIELMAIDEGIRWIFTNGALEEPGDKALLGTMPNLHNHATFELIGDDNTQFREGRVSFRIYESTSVPVGYTRSEVRTLRATNGHLPPLVALSSEKQNKKQLKCQQAVADGTRGYLYKAHQLISDCADAMLSHTMAEAKVKPALRKCDLDENNEKSLIGRIAAEKQKALEKISKKCGALTDSSTPYTASNIHTHLGMAACRAQEMVGATYNNAVEMIGGVLEANSVGDHHEVLEALPCMVASIEG